MENKYTTMYKSIAIMGLLFSGSVYAADHCTSMPSNGKVYTIVNEGSGLVLDVSRKSKEDGADVVQWSANKGTNQQWKVTDAGNGSWFIRPVHSNKTLDVYNWSSSQRTPIKQWSYYGNDNQQWTLNTTQNGGIKIVSRFSRLPIGFENTNRGAALLQLADSSSANQRWYFDPVDGNCEGGNNNNNNTKNNSFFVGNITTYGSVRSDFAQYWDQITPENEGKWASVEGTRDVYNWGGLDAAYHYAKEHNLLFKQHTFVWNGQRPGWIDSLSPSEQAAEIEEWIRDFCTRYPDVDMIDVVNEATPGHAPAEYAKRAFGNDWIIKSFQLARKYCPNATLVLNDYNVLSWNTDAFIAMAKPVVDAGVVDAIGVQSHGLEGWSNEALGANLNKVAALGLPIYVSEYDIAKTNDQEQLQIMQRQFPMLYNHPAVKGITFWGYVYGKTWVEGSGLIHDNGSARPAMNWLMNYLKDHPKN